MQMPRRPRPGRNRRLQRGKQRAHGRAGPGQRRRRDRRARPHQARDQRVQAAPGHVPLGEQQPDEPAAEQALPDRLRRPHRHHRRRTGATAATPATTPPVHHHPDHDLPVDLLNDMITKHRERHPAPRTAIAATVGEVPDHLHPRKMGVVPPLITRPTPPTHPRPRPTPSARLLTPRTGARLLRTRCPLRGPPEQHPLQHRQLGRHPLQLGLARRAPLPQPRVLLPQPAVLLPQPGSQPLPALIGRHHLG